MTQTDDNQNNQQFYTVKEVAKMLRVSGNTVNKLFDSGQLRGVRVGTQRRISKSSYDAYTENISNA